MMETLPGVIFLNWKDKKKARNSLPKTVKMKVTYTRPLFKIQGEKPKVIIINTKKLGMVAVCLVTAIIVALMINSYRTRNLTNDSGRSSVADTSNSDLANPSPNQVAEQVEEPDEIEEAEEGKEPPIIDLSENFIELKASVERINEPTPFKGELIYSGGNAPTIDEPIFRNLFMYNMNTGEENVVAETQIKFGEIYEGRFNENWIVWLDTNQSGINDLYALNRKTGEISKIKSCKLNKPKLQLWGDNLVWVEQLDANQDRLYLYNFKSGEPVSLESFDNPTYGTCPPAISNDILVWVYPAGDNNKNFSVIKKLDLSKALYIPVESDYSGNDEQEAEEQQDVEQQEGEGDTELQGAQHQDVSQEETEGQGMQPSDESTQDEGVDPQLIDPQGFAIYPATNGKVIAWLDNLNPAEANLKMTADDGKTIKTIAYSVGRPFGVGDNFVVYMQKDAIMLYFWEIDRYARLTAPGQKGRLSESGVQGNIVVWYDANDNNRKEDIVRISIIEQPSVDEIK